MYSLGSLLGRRVFFFGIRAEHRFFSARAHQRTALRARWRDGQSTLAGAATSHASPGLAPRLRVKRHNWEEAWKRKKKSDDDSCNKFYRVVLSNALPKPAERTVATCASQGSKSVKHQVPWRGVQERSGSLPGREPDGNRHVGTTTRGQAAGPAMAPSKKTGRGNGFEGSAHQKAIEHIGRKLDAATPENREALACNAPTATPPASDSATGTATARRSPVRTHGALRTIGALNARRKRCESGIRHLRP